MKLPRIVLLSAFFLSAANVRAGEEARRPNILLIISDDQGYGDFGFTGNKDVSTPNLDRLAAESAVFRNFVVAPACSPTRAALMTGRNHLLAGVWGVGARNNLLRDEILMPAFFKADGYHTGYFGKRDGIFLLEMEAWHRGCDEASHVTGYVHRDATSITHTGMVPRKGWTSDVDVDTSLDFIGRMRGRPWWCATAFILPHLPWVCDEKFSAPYRERGLSRELSDFYGSVTQLDDAVGRLLRGLEEAGEADNTIVVYFSDNGPSNRNMTAEDWRSRNPAGLRGAKATVWENGIRGPLLVRWPGHIPPGSRPQFFTVEDVLPTLADLAGLDAERFPPHLPWSGISMREALENPGAAERDRSVFRIAISGEGAVGGKNPVVNDPESFPMKGQHVAQRGPRFKFHQFADGSTALYDIVGDPGETTDISAQHPEILAAYAKRCQEDYNSFLASGRALRMPVVKVGRNTPGRNRVNGIMASRLEGSFGGVGTTSLGGFQSATDRAEFVVDVEIAGDFGIVVTGEKLDSAAGWELAINGRPIPVESADDTRISFGPASLSPGLAKISLSAKSPSQPVTIENISFHP